MQMNPIPYLFLLVAIVVTAVNIFMFAHFGGVQGGGFRPFALILRGILLAFTVFCIIMAWRCRAPAIFGKPKNWLVRRLMGWVYESDRFNAIDLEWSYQKVQSRVLGRYLADKQAGCRCVILREPLLKTLGGMNASNPVFDGLLEGLDNRLQIVKVLDVGVLQKPEPLKPGEEEPVETGLKEETWTVYDLNDLLSAVDDFDLLISCVPLPEGVLDEKGMPAMPSLIDRRLALVGGYGKMFDEGLKSGSVVAAVTYKPDCRFDEKDIPADDGKAFEKRYLLLEGGAGEKSPEAPAE